MFLETVGDVSKHPSICLAAPTNARACSVYSMKVLWMACLQRGRTHARSAAYSQDTVPTLERKASANPRAVHVFGDEQQLPGHLHNDTVYIHKDTRPQHQQVNNQFDTETGSLVRLFAWANPHYDGEDVCSIAWASGLCENAAFSSRTNSTGSYHSHDPTRQQQTGQAHECTRFVCKSQGTVRLVRLHIYVMDDYHDPVCV